MEPKYLVCIKTFDYLIYLINNKHFVAVAHIHEVAVVSLFLCLSLSFFGRSSVDCSCFVNLAGVGKLCDVSDI